MQQKDRQCKYNVTLRCVHEAIDAKSNKYYTFLCVCVYARARVSACVCIRASGCASAGVCALLIQNAPRKRLIVCDLSGTTKFSDIP